jgi:hypothetical protein
MLLLRWTENLYTWNKSHKTSSLSLSHTHTHTQESMKRRYIYLQSDQKPFWFYFRISTYYYCRVVLKFSSMYHYKHGHLVSDLAAGIFHPQFLATCATFSSLIHIPPVYIWTQLWLMPRIYIYIYIYPVRSETSVLFSCMYYINKNTRFIMW